MKLTFTYHKPYETKYSRLNFTLQTDFLEEEWMIDNTAYCKFSKKRSSCDD